MRLLFITQKMDKNDSVLGFVGGWIKEFCNYFDSIRVVCLEKGKTDVPVGVEVFSLGKEGGRSRFKYVINFIRYIVRNRNEYDGVFVHMNPEYVILGGLFWRLWGKRTLLWYNHSAGGLKLRLASFLADRVLHTSPYAASALSAKSRMMPVGVDTEVFKYLGTGHNGSSPRKILSLGRLAPIKGVHLILEAVALLSRTKDIRLTIVGDALPKDKNYKESLLLRAKEVDLAERTEFVSGQPDRLKVAEIMSRHEFFVNASPAGLFDKTVFEACLTECIPIVSSPAFKGILPEECFFEEGNSKSLASVLGNLMAKNPSELDKMRKFLRTYVSREHSLRKLAVMIKDSFYATK